jgi:hypothetical protein
MDTFAHPHFHGVILSGLQATKELARRTLAPDNLRFKIRARSLTGLKPGFGTTPTGCPYAVAIRCLYL